jgi:hypothetical protein
VVIGAQVVTIVIGGEQSFDCGGKNGGGIVVVVVHMMKLATIAGDNLKQK